MSTCLFFFQYAKYLEQQNSIEGVRNVYRRACDIHLPKKPYIHLAWAAFEERQGKRCTGARHWLPDIGALTTKSSLASLAGKSLCVWRRNWAASWESGPVVVVCAYFTIIIIIIYPWTTRVVWVPQMISQPVFSIFSCSPLPSGTWPTPSLSIPWYCLPTSSSVCLVFFPFSLCLARWFWPDLMNRRHDHTTAVCVSLQ